jgi:hypothetical protein
MRLMLKRVCCVMALFPYFGCHGLVSDSKGTASDENRHIEFRVLGSQGLSAVEGAALVLVDKKGNVEILARTDELGRAVVPKAKLRGGQVLLFCRDGYFCGAFQLYDKKFEYLGYDDLSITLSPFSVP